MIPFIICAIIGIIFMMKKRDNPLLTRSTETKISSGVFYGFMFWLIVVNPTIILTFNRDKVNLSLYLKKIEPRSIKSDNDALVFEFENKALKPLKMNVDDLKGLAIINDIDTFQKDTIINKSKIIKSSPAVLNGFIYVGSLNSSYYLEITKSDYKKLPPLYRKEAGKLFVHKNATKTVPVKIYIDKNGKGGDTKETIDSILLKP